MKHLLLLITFLVTISSYAEEIEHPEFRNLFEADLVVDANFKSQDQTYFYIIVNESIKGELYCIKKGDQLKLFREDNGCGMKVDFSCFKHNRYYLKKVPKGWMLNYGSTQSIVDVNQFASLSKSYCGFSNVHIPGRETETMNPMIREFAETYLLDNIKHQYIPTVDSLTLLAKASSNELIAAFERCGRRNLSCKIDEEHSIVPEPIESPSEFPIGYCEIMYQRADYPFPYDILRDSILNNESPLKDIGIEGRVIVKLLIDEKGKVSDVELLSSVHPILDSLAREKAFGMPAWKAAEDRYGNKRKCYTNLPFYFKLPSD